MRMNLGKIMVIGALAAFFCRDAVAQATMGSLDQNADQTQGQYMPMNLGYAGFNSLGMTQAAWLDPLQNLGEGQSKPAYSKYYWSPDLILPIRLREGMMTLLNFPQWELIEDMYIGDNATFDGQISGPNTILLYPRKGANVGVDTNIIIFGRSGNKYVFYVKSEGVNTERLTNSIIDIDVIDGPAGSRGAGMAGGSVGGGSGVNASAYKANNSHSADSLFTKRFQRSDWIKEIPLDPTKFRFDIEVYVPNPDDVVIAPERVWRDDIFTYIDLGEKALNMTQRPIVTLIVERIEVPVGFRTKGPNNRLIIVEGIGDMVMRNGKRLVCLKLRRSDDAGLENATYATDFDDAAWDVPQPLPGGRARPTGGSGSDSEFNGAGGGISGHMPGQFDIQVGQSEIVVPRYGANGGGGNVNIDYQRPYPNDGFDYSKMQHVRNNNQYGGVGGEGGNAGAGGNRLGAGGYAFGSGFTDGDSSSISIELGTDANVGKLETLWGQLSKKYPDVLGRYEPFFSVDAPADGQGKELFHLRVGPVKNLETGDNVCSRLGRNGIFCSVVRTQ